MDIEVQTLSRLSSLKIKNEENNNSQIVFLNSHVSTCLPALQPVCFCVFQTFEGNGNSEEVVRHKLQHAILAHYIRFIPVDWSRKGRIGVRLELYGCSYCK